MKTLSEILGWYGAGAILLAYALASFSIVDSGDVWYQTLNAAGALGIVATSFYHRAFQPAALNLVWFVIALVALFSR